MPLTWKGEAGSGGGTVLPTKACLLDSSEASSLGCLWPCWTSRGEYLWMVGPKGHGVSSALIKWFTKIYTTFIPFCLGSLWVTNFLDDNDCRGLFGVDFFPGWVSLQVFRIRIYCIRFVAAGFAGFFSSASRNQFPKYFYFSLGSFIRSYYWLWFTPLFCLLILFIEQK